MKNFETRKLAHIRNMIGDNTLMPGQIPGLVKVKAPVSGMVLSVHPQFRKDSLLPEGTSIAEIGKVDSLIIRALVYERDVVNMHPGDQVLFFPDSLPEKKLSCQSKLHQLGARHSQSRYTVLLSGRNDLREQIPGTQGRF